MPLHHGSLKPEHIMLTRVSRLRRDHTQLQSSGELPTLWLYLHSDSYDLMQKRLLQPFGSMLACLLRHSTRFRTSPKQNARFTFLMVYVRQLW